jgi:DNA-directed RNA polymerase subunit RPC12/RpoP
MSKGFAGDQSREITCPLCGETILNHKRPDHLRECGGESHAGR